MTNRVRGIIGGLDKLVISHKVRHLHSTSVRYVLDHPKDVRPIIINGAGPGGLVLAHMLRVHRIPYMLCERDMPESEYRNPHSLESWRRKTWRALGVTLKATVLRKLVRRIKIRDVRSFLLEVGSLSVFAWLAARKSIQTSELLAMDRDWDINLERMVKFLRRAIFIHYSHNLHSEAIMLDGEADHPRFEHEQIVSKFQGSMLVGADGVFSEVRDSLGGLESHECDRLFSFPLLATRTVIRLPPSRVREKVSSHLDKNLRTSLLLPNNIRLQLQVSSSNKTQVIIHFTVSRPSKSPADFYNFYDFNPDERNIPFEDRFFSKIFLRELGAYSPLPSPFDTMLFYAQEIPSMTIKVMPMGVVMASKEIIATQIDVKDVSIPAVLIGDAANFLPQIYSESSINQTILDAIELADSISSAISKFGELHSVPSNFYNRARTRWDETRESWENRIAVNHGVPNIWSWTPVRRSVDKRKRMPDVPSESEVRSKLPYVGDGPDVEVYREKMIEISRFAALRDLRYTENIQERRSINEAFRGEWTAKVNKGLANTGPYSGPPNPERNKIVVKYVRTWW